VRPVRPASRLQQRWLIDGCLLRARPRPSTFSVLSSCVPLASFSAWVADSPRGALTSRPDPPRRRRGRKCTHRVLAVSAGCWMLDCTLGRDQDPHFVWCLASGVCLADSTPPGRPSPPESGHDCRLYLSVLTGLWTQDVWSGRMMIASMIVQSEDIRRVSCGPVFCQGPRDTSQGAIRVWVLSVTAIRVERGDV
jgi:hypothetical protein